jgi:hypothetical protein
MELVHEMTYPAMLNPPIPVGDGPFGTRMVFDVTGDGSKDPVSRAASKEQAQTGS